MIGSRSCHNWGSSICLPDNLNPLPTLGLRPRLSADRERGDHWRRRRTRGSGPPTSF